MRNIQKSITFNDVEKSLIEKAAKRYGLTYGSFIRSAALKEAERILGGDDGRGE